MEIVLAAFIFVLTCIIENLRKRVVALEKKVSPAEDETYYKDLLTK